MASGVRELQWIHRSKLGAATACCTNDAELGTEFLARSSNVSMKKYTSKDVGLEGWGSTPVAFVDPGPDEANFGPSRSMNQ